MERIKETLGSIEIWSEPQTKGGHRMCRFTIKESTALAFQILLGGEKLLIFDKKRLTDILIADFAAELAALAKKGKKK